MAATAQTFIHASNTYRYRARILSESSRALSLQLANQQRRTFFPNPFASSNQKLSASRVLPYPNSIIYQVITDVASYKHFIPYCLSSEVLKYSNNTEDGRRWPEEAKLLIGFNGDVSETFWSRVYCVPERIVETVAGNAETSLPPEQITHHNPRLPAGQDPVRQGNVMKNLATKWELQPHGQGTEVSVKIEYEFANPVYAALSSAASPMVADKMIGAFQKRVEAVIASSGSDRTRS